jgi:hypothetical protein
LTLLRHPRAKRDRQLAFEALGRLERERQPVARADFATRRAEQAAGRSL